MAAHLSSSLDSLQTIMYTHTKKNHVQYALKYPVLIPVNVQCLRKEIRKASNRIDAWNSPLAPRTFALLKSWLSKSCDSVLSGSSGGPLSVEAPAESVLSALAMSSASLLSSSCSPELSPPPPFGRPWTKSCLASPPTLRRCSCCIKQKNSSCKFR